MERADACKHRAARRASRDAHAAGRAHSGRDRAELAPLEALMNEPHQAAFQARASFRASFCERSDTGVTKRVALDLHSQKAITRKTACIAVEDFHRPSRRANPCWPLASSRFSRSLCDPRTVCPSISQATRRGIVVEMERNGGRPSPQAYDSAQQEVLRGVCSVCDVYVRFLDTREGARWVTDHYAWSHHARGISRLQARHRGRTTRKLGGDVPAIAKAYWRRIDELNADVEDLGRTSIVGSGQKARTDFALLSVRERPIGRKSISWARGGGVVSMRLSLYVLA